MHIAFCCNRVTILIAVLLPNLGYLVSLLIFFFIYSEKQPLGITGTALFTDQVPFLSPNQQCQSTKASSDNLIIVIINRDPNRGKLPADFTLSRTTSRLLREGLLHFINLHQD